MAVEGVVHGAPLPPVFSHAANRSIDCRACSEVKPILIQEERHVSDFAWSKHQTPRGRQCNKSNKKVLNVKYLGKGK